MSIDNTNTLMGGIKDRIASDKALLHREHGDRSEAPSLLRQRIGHDETCLRVLETGSIPTAADVLEDDSYSFVRQLLFHQDADGVWWGWKGYFSYSHGPDSREVGGNRWLTI